MQPVEHYHQFKKNPQANIHFNQPKFKLILFKEKSTFQIICSCFYDPQENHHFPSNLEATGIRLQILFQARIERKFN
jgi:hypothetical protein